MLRAKKLGLGAALLLVASAAFAADVKVTGLHNCCGGCASGITATLEKAGATNIMLKQGDLSFTAENGEKAIQALFDAGYTGKVEGAKTPKPQDLKGVKGKTVKVEGVHLCCGRCVRGVNTALEKLGKTDAAPNAKSFTVTAETEIEAAAVLDALNKAGYAGKIAK